MSVPFQIEKKRQGRGGCDFVSCNNVGKVKLETPVCAGCGEKHGIDFAEFDSDNIKENIRVIDSNRDYLFRKVEGMTEELLELLQKDDKRVEKLQSGLRQAKGAVGEMNQAVREICVESWIYQQYPYLKAAGKTLSQIEETYCVKPPPDVVKKAKRGDRVKDSVFVRPPTH